MVACCLALLLMHSSGGPTNGAQQPPGLRDQGDRRLTIAVFSPPDVTASLVDRIFAEATAIWTPAGISLDWHRVSPVDVVRTWQLDVTIDDGSRRVVTDHALGWVFFTPDGPETSIHLSRVNAEASVLRTAGVDDTSALTHEVLVGRALGRALAHELGHYLLKSKEHSPGGLMRASWRSEEFLAVGRSGFELTAEQREIAAHFVQEPHA